MTRTRRARRVTAVMANIMKIGSDDDDDEDDDDDDDDDDEDLVEQQAA